MWQSAKVAVVVPCFREARLIERTLAGMPAFVDLIVVVDDASDDGTAEVVLGVGDPRVELVVHAREPRRRCRHRERLPRRPGR